MWWASSGCAGCNGGDASLLFDPEWKEVSKEGEGGKEEERLRETERGGGESVNWAKEAIVENILHTARDTPRTYGVLYCTPTTRPARPARPDPTTPRSPSRTKWRPPCIDRRLLYIAHRTSYPSTPSHCALTCIHQVTSPPSPLRPMSPPSSVPSVASPLLPPPISHPPLVMETHPVVR